MNRNGTSAAALAALLVASGFGAAAPDAPPDSADASFAEHLAGCCEKCRDLAEKACKWGVRSVECRGIFSCECKFECHEASSARVRALHLAVDSGVA